MDATGKSAADLAPPGDPARPYGSAAAVVAYRTVAAELCNSLQFAGLQGLYLDQLKTLAERGAAASGDGEAEPKGEFPGWISELLADGRIKTFVEMIATHQPAASTPLADASLGSVMPSPAARYGIVAARPRRGSAMPGPRGALLRTSSHSRVEVPAELALAVIRQLRQPGPFPPQLSAAITLSVSGATVAAGAADPKARPLTDRLQRQRVMASSGQKLHYLQKPENSLVGDSHLVPLMIGPPELDDLGRGLATASWSVVLVAVAKVREAAVAAAENNRSPVAATRMTDFEYGLLEMVAMAGPDGVTVAALAEALGQPPRMLAAALDKLASPEGGAALLKRFMTRGKTRQFGATVNAIRRRQYKFIGYRLARFSGGAGGGGVRWMVGKREICSRLGGCSGQVALLAEFKALLLGATNARSAALELALMELSEMKYIQLFQSRVRGKLKECIRLVTAYPDEDSPSHEIDHPTTLVYQAVLAAAGQGAAIGDLCVKFGLSLSTARLICIQLTWYGMIQPVGESAADGSNDSESWNPLTRFAIHDGTSKMAVAVSARAAVSASGKAKSSVDKCAVSANAKPTFGASGRVISLKDQGERRMRVLNCLLEEQKVLVYGICIRRLLQEREAEELGVVPGRAGAALADNKTMARLKAKMVSSKLCRELVRTVVLSSGKSSEVKLLVQTGLSDDSPEVEEALRKHEIELSAPRTMKGEEGYELVAPLDLSGVRKLDGQLIEAPFRPEPRDPTEACNQVSDRASKRKKSRAIKDEQERSTPVKDRTAPKSRRLGRYEKARRVHLYLTDLVFGDSSPEMAAPPQLLHRATISSKITVDLSGHGSTQASNMQIPQPPPPPSTPATDNPADVPRSGSAQTSATPSISPPVPDHAGGAAPTSSQAEAHVTVVPSRHTRRPTNTEEPRTAAHSTFDAHTGQLTIADVAWGMSLGVIDHIYGDPIPVGLPNGTGAATPFKAIPLPIRAAGWPQMRDPVPRLKETLNTLMGLKLIKSIDNAAIQVWTGSMLALPGLRTIRTSSSQMQHVTFRMSRVPVSIEIVDTRATMAPPSGAPPTSLRFNLTSVAAVREFWITLKAICTNNSEYNSTTAVAGFSPTLSLYNFRLWTNAAENRSRRRSSVAKRKRLLSSACGAKEAFKAKTQHSGPSKAKPKTTMPKRFKRKVGGSTETGVLPPPPPPPPPLQGASPQETGKKRRKRNHFVQKEDELSLLAFVVMDKHRESKPVSWANISEFVKKRCQIGPESSKDGNVYRHRFVNLRQKSSAKFQLVRHRYCRLLESDPSYEEGEDYVLATEVSRLEAADDTGSPIPMQLPSSLAELKTNFAISVLDEDGVEIVESAAVVGTDEDRRLQEWIKTVLWLGIKSFDNLEYLHAKQELELKAREADIAAALEQLRNVGVVTRSKTNSGGFRKHFFSAVYKKSLKVPFPTKLGIEAKTFTQDVEAAGGDGLAMDTHGLSNGAAAATLTQAARRQAVFKFTANAEFWDAASGQRVSRGLGDVKPDLPTLAEPIGEQSIIGGPAAIVPLPLLSSDGDFQMVDDIDSSSSSSLLQIFPKSMVRARHFKADDLFRVKVSWREPTPTSPSAGVNPSLATEAQESGSALLDRVVAAGSDGASSSQLLAFMDSTRPPDSGVACISETSAINALAAKLDGLLKRREVACVGFDEPRFVAAAFVGPWCGSNPTNGLVRRAWTKPSGVTNVHVLEILMNRVYALVCATPGAPWSELYQQLRQSLNAVDLKVLLAELVRCGRLEARRQSTLSAVAPMLFQTHVPPPPGEDRVSPSECLVSNALSFSPSIISGLYV